MTDAKVPTEGQNIGHGHVFPRPDGVLARCGGPAMCPACARDLARKNIEAGSSGGASGGVDTAALNRKLCAEEGHVLGVAARPCLRCHEWFDPQYGRAPEPAGQQWQPIETAPKGRILLLGYWNDLGNWRTVMGCYYAEETLESETEDSGFAPPGWYESTQTYEYLAALDKEPTHWQPLPKGLPKSSQETKGEKP